MAAIEIDLRIEGFEERILFIRTVKLRLHGTKMAALLGVPHATLKTWENKENPAKPRDIVDIADRYVKVCADHGITITADWLLRGGLQLSSYLTSVDLPQEQTQFDFETHRPRAHVA